MPIELVADDWDATADPYPERASQAIDRDPSTRWDTDRGQEPGQRFELDLGSVAQVARVVLDDDGGGRSVYINDYPREYTISVSTDGKRWTQVGSGEGDPPCRGASATLLPGRLQTGSNSRVSASSRRYTLHRTHPVAQGQTRVPRPGRSVPRGTGSCSSSYAP